MPELNNIDVFFSVQSFQEEDLRGKTAVIIDVLRASSTIITALNNQAKQIIPVGDMEEASKLSRTIDSNDFLLCGEKDGKKIEGYDLGNSPLEYSADKVKNKKLILNTSNGTKAIKKAHVALHIYVGAFLNLKALAETLSHHDEELVLICSGWRGRLSLEDSLFAGALIHQLANGALPDDAKDGAKVVFGLFEKFGFNLKETIKKTDHANRLKDMVTEEEIEFCCNESKFDVIPQFKDGIITNING